MSCLGTNARVTQELFPRSRMLTVQSELLERGDWSAPRRCISVACLCVTWLLSHTHLLTIPEHLLSAAQAGVLLNLRPWAEVTVRPTHQTAAHSLKCHRDSCVFSLLLMNNQPVPRHSSVSGTPGQRCLPRRGMVFAKDWFPEAGPIVSTLLCQLVRVNRAPWKDACLCGCPPAPIGES